MKTILLLSITLLYSFNSLACDKILEQFPRDCLLQDRLESIKQKLKKKNVDINDVADYRAIRFIDRATWDWAVTYRVKPVDIYKPTPTTWEVWSRGIDTIFVAGDELPGILWRGFQLNRDVFASMNFNLLVDGDKNIKDPITDKTKKPGEYRQSNDKGVGYCDSKNPDARPELAASRASMQAFQTEWEKLFGLTFPELVVRKMLAVVNVAPPQMYASMTQGESGNCTGSWVSYIPSAEVPNQIEWVRIFIDANLDLYKENKPILSPVELAAYTQKWFVTIHPFSDGNGRTSRAIQDMILGNFGLPFAPAGDLWRDASEVWPVYLENTYKAMEKVMTSLEECIAVDYMLPLVERPFKCATTSELNK